MESITAYSQKANGHTNKGGTKAVPLGMVLRQGSIICYWASITPRLAEEWLTPTVNNQNRRPKEAVVERYSREMREGTWLCTHESIAFDTDGILIDGQHRLQAIVASGVSCTILVFENLSPDVRVKIDQGPGRTMADNLTIMGVATNARLVAAAVNVINRFLNGHNYKRSFEEMIADIARYRDGLNWAQHAIKTGSLSIKGPILGALVYAYPSAPSHIERIQLEIENGATPGSTIFSLRDFVMKKGLGGGEGIRQEVFRKALSAFHADIHGEKFLKTYLSESRVAWFGKAYK